uniref:Uncharacterized protein n=1 Tax=uncultured marine microorganism HF4000_48F7 TaxID=455500 RepID=B3SZW0_9ZZZZ|nr:hypothetical protein ALOHA_HF400048F7ctg1g35 [uncultured marine microorganism HF4000_48F7]
MRRFLGHHPAVFDSPLYRLTQSLTLEICFVPHRGFILLLAVRGLVATRFAAVKSVLVAGFKLGATDRAVFLINLACDVLVLVTTFFAAKDAAQHSQRRATVLTLCSARSLQPNIGLVPLVRFEAATRTIFMVYAALRKKRGTLRALHLLRRPAHIVFDAPRPCGFVIAVLVAILGVAVAVVEHPLALGAAFHCSLPLFTAYIFGCAFHAAVPVSLIARCKLFPAPDTRLWKVDPILFTGQGDSFADRNDRPCYRIPKAVVTAFCSCHNQGNTAVLNCDMSP